MHCVVNGHFVVKGHSVVKRHCVIKEHSVIKCVIEILQCVKGHCDVLWEYCNV